LIAAENVKHPLARAVALKFHQADFNRVFPGHEIGNRERKVAAMYFITERRLVTRRVRDQESVARAVVILAGDRHFLIAGAADFLGGEGRRGDA